jgi:hypothetical protein
MQSCVFFQRRHDNRLIRTSRTATVPFFGMAVVVTSSSSRHRGDEVVAMELGVRSPLPHINDVVGEDTVTSRCTVTSVASSSPSSSSSLRCGSESINGRLERTMTPDVVCVSHRYSNENDRDVNPDNGSSNSFISSSDQQPPKKGRCESAPDSSASAALNAEDLNRAWPSPTPKQFETTPTNVLEQRRRLPRAVDVRVEIVDVSGGQPAYGCASPQPGDVASSPLTRSSAADEPISRTSPSSETQKTSPFDLPDCVTVRRRVSSRRRNWPALPFGGFFLQDCWPGRTPYPRLVHPLDKGLFLSFAVSIIYLAAAVVAVCPSICIVVFVLPVAVLVRRAVVRCAAAARPETGRRHRRASTLSQPSAGAAAAATAAAADVHVSQSEFNVDNDGRFDADLDEETDMRTPLTGHEEFWIGQKSVVTQCLVAFDGRLDVEQMRELIQTRLINRRPSSSLSNGESLFACCINQYKADLLDVLLKDFANSFRVVNFKCSEPSVNTR